MYRFMDVVHAVGQDRGDCRFCFMEIAGAGLALVGEFPLCPSRARRCAFIDALGGAVVERVMAAASQDTGIGLTHLPVSHIPMRSGAGAAGRWPACAFGN